MRCGARRTGWPRTKFWPTTRGWSAITCASTCPPFSSGAVCRWTAFICARGGGRGRSASVPWCPRAIVWWRAARAPRGAAAWPCSRRTSLFPWRMAARCASTTFCARWRSSSISSCSPSPMRAWNWRRCWSFARAWCWWKSPAIASRAGVRCCRPRFTSSRPPAMKQAIIEERRAFAFETLQVEYTQLAEYGAESSGDILVEHDVTSDLFTQIARHERTLSAAWDAFRWRRFETRALRQFPRVVVMSEKDAEMVGVPSTVIPNGVDFARFRAAPENPGERLLFIGSFRHFPNVAAYRFFTEEVWPLLRDKFPEMSLTVVSGADYLTYWRAFADSPEPAPDARIRLLGFVSDVRPLYVESNLVLAPTTVSAGTNVKVLEAMAMERAVVSTSSGCAGLGLVHGHSVWVADSAVAFAAGVATLINDPERRRQMARAAYGVALRNFDWAAIGEKQRALLDARLTAPK